MEDFELAFVEYKLTGFYVTSNGERKELTDEQRANHKWLKDTVQFKTAVLKK